MNTLVSEILFNASFLFILVGAFVALVLGFSLIVSPKATLKFNEKINTRISLRKATKKIETPIKSEPYFYRYSKISGAILILGSLFILYTLNTFNIYSLVPYLPKSITPTVWSWLLEASQIFFYFSASFILLFGFIVFIRPSAVKNFEQAANHWISTRQGFAKMTNDINFTNRLVNAYPRIFGSFISILAVIVLFLLLPNI